jgi:hypothetical protein
MFNFNIASCATVFAIVGLISAQTPATAKESLKEKCQIANSSSKCKIKSHFSKDGRHYFVLGESRLGGGDVLAPDDTKQQEAGKG